MRAAAAGGFLQETSPRKRLEKRVITRPACAGARGGREESSGVAGNAREAAAARARKEQNSPPHTVSSRAANESKTADAKAEGFWDKGKFEAFPWGGGDGGRVGQWKKNSDWRRRREMQCKRRGRESWACATGLFFLFWPVRLLAWPS